MVYGEDKAHEMARSLLPSTWRGAQRAKARIHRASRRRSKLEVSQSVRDAEEAEALNLTAIERDEARELRWVVRDRRWADKVNPFIRWATAVTRELPQEQRLSHVRGCVPRGVIGEHAVAHLRGTRAFEDPWEREWRQARWGQHRRTWLDRGEYAELLREVLRVGGHDLFNKFLLARHVPRTGREECRRPDPHHPGHFIEDMARARPRAISVRLLMGLHDVLPFLDTVGSWGRRIRGNQHRFTVPAPNHHSTFMAMDRFLRAFKQHRGHLEATLRTLEATW